MKSITVSATVAAPLVLVWECWTEPVHVTKWNHASDDWECPSAENDLREGGRFVARMSAKDGSDGFDFGGAYTTVEPMCAIGYTLDDNRKVAISFTEKDGGVEVTETFEMENENSEELQRTGWQAILNNFKQYVETN